MFNFMQSPISHNLRDPHSKALEPDRLSPPLAITTQPLWARSFTLSSKTSLDTAERVKSISKSKGEEAPLWNLWIHRDVGFGIWICEDQVAFMMMLQMMLAAWSPRSAALLRCL